MGYTNLKKYKYNNNNNNINNNNHINNDNDNHKISIITPITMIITLWCSCYDDFDNHYDEGGDV
jgi:hypothetical protein